MWDKQAIEEELTYPGQGGPVWGAFSRYDRNGCLAIETSAFSTKGIRFGLFELSNNSLRVFRLDSESGSMQFVTAIDGLKNIALIGLNSSEEGGCCMLEYSIAERYVLRKIQLHQPISRMLGITSDGCLAVMREFARNIRELQFLEVNFRKEGLKAKTVLDRNEDLLSWSEQNNVMAGRLPP